MPGVLTNMLTSQFNNKTISIITTIISIFFSIMTLFIITFDERLLHNHPIIGWIIGFFAIIIIVNNVLISYTFITEKEDRILRMMKIGLAFLYLDNILQNYENYEIIKSALLVSIQLVVIAAEGLRLRKSMK
jgi:quinol-cytochrome oxidoreductase complex cytochrome b subunit